MSTIEDIKDVAGVVSDIFDNVSDIFGGQDTPKSPEEETEHPTLRESEEVWEGAKTELRIDNGKVYEIVFDEDGVPLRSIEVKLDPYPPLDEPEPEEIAKTRPDEFAGPTGHKNARSSAKTLASLFFG